MFAALKLQCGPSGQASLADMHHKFLRAGRHVDAVTERVESTRCQLSTLVGSWQAVALHAAAPPVCMAGQAEHSWRATETQLAQRWPLSGSARPRMASHKPTNNSSRATRVLLRPDSHSNNAQATSKTVFNPQGKSSPGHKTASSTTNHDCHNSPHGKSEGKRCGEHDTRAYRCRSSRPCDLSQGEGL